MVFLNSRMIFGQINCMTPKIRPVKAGSICNDFEFVNKMFYRTGLDIREGISAFKKSNDKERKSRSYR